MNLDYINTISQYKYKMRYSWNNEKGQHFTTSRACSERPQIETDRSTNQVTNSAYHR